MSEFRKKFVCIECIHKKGLLIMLRHCTLEIICKFISFIEIEVILLCTVPFYVKAFFNIGKVDFFLTDCDSCYFDRVCSVAEPFLLVLYSPLHSKPEFYDVTIQNAEGNMQFDLYTGYEVVSLPKVCSRFFFLLDCVLDF